MVKSINTANTLGRRNIPRYLYHLTSKDNYKSMVKEGILKTHLDCALDPKLDGVFMFDIINFVKRWCNSGSLLGKRKHKLTLSKGLFFSVAIKNPQMVLLKVPTKNLDLNKLRCRAQIFNDKVSDQHKVYGDYATNQKHYTRNKYPIEYIYEDSISINNIEILGELDSKIATKRVNPSVFQKQINVFEFLKKLFKNQPELNAIYMGEKSSIPFQEID